MHMILTGGPAAPRGPLGPGAPTLPCKTVSRYEIQASPKSKAIQSLWCRRQDTYNGAGGSSRTSRARRTSITFNTSITRFTFRTRLAISTLGRRENGEWRSGGGSLRAEGLWARGRATDRDLEMQRHLETPVPPHPSPLTQGNTSVLIQPPKVPCLVSQLGTENEEGLDTHRGASKASRTRGTSLTTVSLEEEGDDFGEMSQH